MVTLTWTDNSSNETGFEIERSTTGSGGSYTLLTTTAADATTYQNTGLSPSTEYRYRVRAVNGAGQSSYTSVSCVTTPAPPTPPAAPSGLGAVATSYGVITLTWTDNSDNETGFEIERSTTGSGGPFTLLTTTAAGVVTYRNTGLSPSTEYCYRVRAVNGGGQSSYTSVSCATTPAEGIGNIALQFTTASGTYVTFGDPAKLDLATFTIETWFKRTGAGTPNTTGSGGIVNAIPLVTHGSPQADGSNVDANWVLAIDDATDVIAADFEDMATGLNHPVSGVTPIVNDVWYHAAATYDGTTWRLYLNGNLEATLVVGAYTPRSDSIQQVGLGTMIESGGTPHGYFQGVIDEARVWNVARTRSQIRADINSQLTSGTGLVARWGLNEGSGTVVRDSITTVANGTITGANYTWVTPGAPFNLTFDTTPPAAPTGLFAIGANGSVALDWNDNTDADLAGYNVYRGTTSGVYTKINSSVVTASAYNDTGLTNGTEYYYVVRAVDTSGNESPNSNEAYAIPQLEAGSALQFTTAGGTYVTFGDPAKLDLATFTIETWFKRTGPGTPNTTGTDGFTSALPLVTHGSPENEGGTVDANWMLVINDTTDVIGVDFEDMVTGGNHPLSGVTPLTDNVWYHAAATFDGTTMRLYLNGKLESSLVTGALPRSDTTQQAALGTMLTTTGSPNGYFQGVLDEARVWSRALTQTEIIANINHQLTSGSGLVARWGLNEGTGAAVGDSVATPANGTITGANYAWVPGAPFDINLAPNTPTLVSPLDMATSVPVSTPLTVQVSDARNSSLTVSFYGRVQGATGGEDFTLIAIPDPQYYALTAYQ